MRTFRRAFLFVTLVYGFFTLVVAVLNLQWWWASVFFWITAVAVFLISPPESSVQDLSGNDEITIYPRGKKRRPHTHGIIPPNSGEAPMSGDGQHETPEIRAGREGVKRRGI